MLDSAHLDPAHLDATFAALADPTRRAILERLLRGKASVGELAAPFPISLPAVSRHLRVLERAGLVDRRRLGRQRQVRLRAAALREAEAWLARYRQFWTDRFDDLEAFLMEDES